MAWQNSINMSQRDDFPRENGCHDNLEASPLSLKRQLEILWRILEYFPNDLESEDYNVITFLKQQPEEEREAYANMLNQMADMNDIIFMEDNTPCENRIDITANPVIGDKVVFRLGKNPCRKQLEIMGQMFREISILSEKQDDMTKQIKILDRLKEEIENVTTIRKQMKEELCNVEKKFNDISNQKSSEMQRKITEVDKHVEDRIEEELVSSGKIGAFMQSVQKDIVQYMAIFIAIFSLINLNVGGVGVEKRSLTDYLGVNLLLVSSMVTLFALLESVFYRIKAKNDTKKISAGLWVASALLWVITAVLFWLTQCM